MEDSKLMTTQDPGCDTSATNDIPQLGDDRGALVVAGWMPASRAYKRFELAVERFSLSTRQVPY